ncbi:hypothetical protein Zmor_000741 [Zophobas morio]|uniref:Uncharacterized protein n=1 Tax=Zophobas morio TaxID=2755281 RepID=A0AA38IWY0_9CUCU|nr:hypothetical protein Zmor_000741 [Zophobas morio]
MPHRPHCTHAVTGVRHGTKSSERVFERTRKLVGEAVLDVGKGCPRWRGPLVGPEGGGSPVGSVVHAAEPVVERGPRSSQPWVAEDDVVGEVLNHQEFFVVLLTVDDDVAEDGPLGRGGHPLAGQLHHDRSASSWSGDASADEVR